jgi:hypothetical protein
VRFAGPGSDAVTASDMPGRVSSSSAAFDPRGSCSTGDSNGKLSKDSMLTARPFSALMTPSILSEPVSSSTGAGCSDSGDASCLLKARSLKDDIAASFLARRHGPTDFISKAIVEVLDRRSIFRRPPINPDKFRTTVAIIDNLIFPCETVCETKYGITKPYYTSAYQPEC